MESEMLANAKTGVAVTQHGELRKGFPAGLETL